MQFLTRKILYIYVREMNKRQIKGDYKMGKNYEMVTLNAYLNNLEDKNVISLNDKSIELAVEKYLISQKRAESNAKTLEALLA